MFGIAVNRTRDARVEVTVARALVAVVVACFVFAVEGSTTSAQTPGASATAVTRTPAPATVTPSMPVATVTPVPAAPLSRFPFRVVLSGPTTAAAKSEISYTLTYQRTAPDGVGNAIVLVFGPAALVSVTASVGPAPVDEGAQIPDESENFAFAGDAGTWQIALRPAAGFTGELSVSFYVRGTGIDYPPGTIDRVATEVVRANAAPRAMSLPSTGAGPDESATRVVVVALFGFAIGMCVLVRAHRVRQRV